MTIKEIEQRLVAYIESEEIYNHKEKALKEFDKARVHVGLDNLIHIGFIVDNYPNYDHFLLKMSDDNFFLHFGLSRKYLKSLSKKDIHKVAKAIHTLFGDFKLKE